MQQKKLSPENVYKASRILDLGERASLADIKNRYRKLIKSWHPDKCNDKPEQCREKTKEITWAYEIIVSYCNNYLYSFKKDDIVNNLPVDIQMKERWKKQFMDGHFSL
ncbi:J domain-containing protein [Halothermothrix orenii]|uniref:Heat shock protein DnaJ domain protein n=1 Tax=Halothermothrix orenii (strain H 168 / OCM 544 / DSM 9562) TaxID=373903 RepID=B8CYA9_HALOH|nr:J domain-containing protein [Halothermothrix orenii]ACL70278.1 heat shock protein DnaJ domain protein [Halothermothrix orenii H 168]